MTMVDEQAWLHEMREAAGRAVPDDEDEGIHVQHGRVAGMAFQFVSAGGAARGKRLLILEIGERDEARVLAALAVLAGAERIERSSALLESAVLSVERRT